jgi:hypothetical protein
MFDVEAANAAAPRGVLLMLSGVELSGSRCREKGVMSGRSDWQQAEATESKAGRNGTERRKLSQGKAKVEQDGQTHKKRLMSPCRHNSQGCRAEERLKKSWWMQGEGWQGNG